MWSIIDLIPLIGYSIQNGENISTNENTQFFKTSHAVYNPAYD